MLELLFGHRHRTCDGMTRREIMQVGALGLGSLMLPNLLRARAQASARGAAQKDTSVVWLWLSGGPTHIETFDPKMDAPVEYRSAVGAVQTAVPGVHVGGLFPKMGTVADRMAFVRSFAHTNSGHGGGTHWVMTGRDHAGADSGVPPIWPSVGSVMAAVRGPSHPVTGMPAYVGLDGILGDGGAWLGASYAPFYTSGPARENMRLLVDAERLGDRKMLLETFDRMRRDLDRSGTMEGMDTFVRQAFGLVTGKAREAFDLAKEDPRVMSLYGSGFGQKLLIARRLCEQGCGLVTLAYANAAQGWDMHGSANQPAHRIEVQMGQAAPPLDHAVAAFIEDLAQRGLSEKILLVITGEFGRTPRINQFGGRDHWAPLSTLALAGGGLKMGQVVGESSARAEVPKSTPITPQDLLATVLHVLGIDPDVQFVDQAGRPQNMVYGKPIPELV